MQSNCLTGPFWPLSPPWPYQLCFSSIYMLYHSCTRISGRGNRLDASWPCVGPNFLAIECGNNQRNDITDKWGHTGKENKRGNVEGWQGGSWPWQLWLGEPGLEIEENIHIQKDKMGDIAEEGWLMCPWIDREVTVFLKMSFWKWWPWESKWESKGSWPWEGPTDMTFESSWHSGRGGSVSWSDLRKYLLGMIRADLKGEYPMLVPLRRLSVIGGWEERILGRIILGVRIE